MIEWTEILLRLVLAAVFGAAIGLERERKEWAAGMRTHMMVCVGATLFMLVSAYGFSGILGTPDVVLDPSRIAAQVVSGIGFIGAGTILFQKQGTIRGLTTASGMWTVAAIGLATGGGMYFAAAVATVLAIIILWVLQPVEKSFASRFVQRSISVTTTGREQSVQVITAIFDQHQAQISNCYIERSGENEFHLSFRFKGINRQQLKSIITELQKNPDITNIDWQS